MPCITDIRDENSVQAAVQEAVIKFGGIDVLVNNASAISLTGTAETTMKRLPRHFVMQLTQMFICYVGLHFVMADLT